MFYGKPGSDDAGVLFARKANELHIGMKPGKWIFPLSRPGSLFYAILTQNLPLNVQKLLHPGSARFCFPGT